MATAPNGSGYSLLQSLRKDASILKQLVYAQSNHSSNVSSEVATLTQQKEETEEKLNATTKLLHEARQAAAGHERLLAESSKTIARLQQLQTDRETSVRREVRKN